MKYAWDIWVLTPNEMVQLPLTTILTHAFGLERQELIRILQENSEKWPWRDTHTLWGIIDIEDHEVEVRELLTKFLLATKTD